jgi:hypothetical protein
MVWFYTKEQARLHYEIRRQSDGPDFELVVTHPDGRQEIERFEDSMKLLNRSQHLQQTLRAEGWQPLG